MKPRCYAKSSPVQDTFQPIPDLTCSKWKTFEGENFHELVKNMIFMEKTFCRLLAFAVPKEAMPPNFAEKTFANSHKTTKFTEVFSLESFPLYSTLCPYAYMHVT